MDKKYKRLVFGALLATFVVAGFLYLLPNWYFSVTEEGDTAPQTQDAAEAEPQDNATEDVGSEPNQESESVFAAPIADAKSRITKKPFGIYVTPGSSPVKNERFTGYHNAVDFEAPESGTVPIYAVCSGEVVVSNLVSGYGGLVIQSCELEGEPITVLYGHVDISSPVSADVGNEVSKGDQISVLAEVGRYTDGERKHLHLGIHKGSRVVYAGYVDTESELEPWINFEKYL